MLYEVTIKQFKTIEIEASSEKEALTKAKKTLSIGESVASAELVEGQEQ